MATVTKKTLGRGDYFGGLVIAHIWAFGHVFPVQRSAPALLIPIGLVLIVGVLALASMRERDIVNARIDQRRKPIYWRVKAVVGLAVVRFIGVAVIATTANKSNTAAYVEMYGALIDLLLIFPNLSLLLQRGQGYYDSKARKEHAQMLKAAKAV